MKKIIVTGFVIAFFSACHAQKAENIITPKEVARVENVLASDAMRGRKVFSPEIDQAADFIAAEFKAAGLQTFNGANSFLQPFSVLRSLSVNVEGSWGETTLNNSNAIAISAVPKQVINRQSGFEIDTIKPGVNFRRAVGSVVQGKRNVIVLVDPSYSQWFSSANYFRRAIFTGAKTVVLILGTSVPDNFTIYVKQELEEKKLANVVGVLPGKTKQTEYVVFSGHYDHLGVDPTNKEDSIYNGANDDAAGTTAVILLARYFAARHDNDRTLVFAAFTAEEIGGYGSDYFSRQFDADSVMAMFNIEMIGTESKWGPNSAYITGYEKTNMGELLQKDLAGSDFKFYPDPYTQQQLFYRSDNATLARLGVPAHTISTSKMDSEPNYHKVSDEVKTLDLDNMARIIRAIALSSRSIIAGTATPTRVDTAELR